MIELETIGMRVVFLRQSKNWTQADLARVLKVTRATVMKWESDAVVNIKPANLLTLAKVLGVDPYYLVFGKEGKPKEGWPMIPVK